MYDCSGVLKRVVNCGDHVAVTIEHEGETHRFRGEFPEVAPVLEKLVDRPVEWTHHPLHAELANTLWFEVADLGAGAGLGVADRAILCGDGLFVFLRSQG